jgi:hypothetical protein
MITLLNGEQWDREALLAKMTSDDFYYGHLGKFAHSSSSVKMLQRSPKTYYHVTKYGQEQDSTALQVGSFIHTMILEPETFADKFEIVDVQSRVAKAFKDAKAKSSKIVLTAKEHDENMRIVDAAMRNEHVLDLIRGCKFEVPEVQMLEGYAFRAKADIYDPKWNFICDLKSTREIHGFKYSAEKFGYDIQAWIYTTMFGVKAENFKFLAIDKDSLDIGIFDVTDSFLNKGYKKVREALDNYKTFFRDHNSLDNYTLRGTLE